MFKSLKEKLSGALKRFSKNAEHEAKETEEIAEEDREVEETLEGTVEEPQAPIQAESEAPEPSEGSPEPEEPELDHEPEGPGRRPAGTSAEPDTPERTPSPRPKDSATASPRKREKEEQAESEGKREKKTEGLEKERAAREETEREERAGEEALETPEQDRAERKQKKGLFSRVTEKFTTIELSEERFEELFWDIELALLENNVAVEVIEKLKADLRDELTTGRTARGGLEERVLRRMRESLQEVLSAESIDLLAEADARADGPLVVALVGVNGSGKTTTAAKLARYFLDNGKSVVLGACDTFRAAAIQQLEHHAEAIGVPIVKQEYGSDPAAVAYDTVQHAASKGVDVVILDTAGRLHSNKNLMDELAKVVRVAKPHHVIFVGESITGNDCVEQARIFSETLPVDGVILSKADVDEKGGAAVSVSYVTGKPILLIGTGQAYADLAPFDPEGVIDRVLPAS